MNWPIVLSELRTAGVIVIATLDGDLELDAPSGVLSEAKLTVLREHKAEIVSLLLRRCPFCKQSGMTTDETEQDGLLYFDTSCLHCGQLVEIFIPPRQNLAEIQDTVG